MAGVYTFILVTLSAYMVAARPGVRQVDEMECHITAGACMTFMMKADLESTQGQLEFCSTEKETFLACVDNVPATCSMYTDTLNEMRKSVDQMCSGAVCNNAIMPCINIIQRIRGPSEVCSIKGDLLSCVDVIPEVCKYQDLYVGSVGSLLPMIRETSCPDEP